MTFADNVTVAVAAYSIWAAYVRSRMGDEATAWMWAGLLGICVALKGTLG